MAEAFETDNQERPDFARYLDIARRRHIHFLVPLLLGWLVVWGLSWVLSPRYKSSTLILVQEPSMPQNFVIANVADDLQSRLQNMQQQILSRTRLLMIIDSQHLYSDPHHPMNDDDKVAQMRKEIAIDLVRDTQNAGVTAFRIDYSAHDPRVAQRVTGELAELFINENQQTLLGESRDTTKFLDTQLEAARNALAEQEAQVKAFQASHMGALPSQEASNLQILSGLQSQLQNEQDALNNATQQRALHQTEIQNFRSTLPPPRTDQQDPNGVEALDARLAKLRDQLTDLETRYTDNYPDVQKTKLDIAETRKLRAQAVAAEKAKGANSGLTPEQSAALVQLQGQLQSDEVEIQNRQRSIQALQARISDYEARINAEPASAQQLADLTRGYEQSQANYNDLLKKQQESQMATNMEQMQQGERFTMLDPPSLPARPDFPDRFKFCLMGLLVGVALGGLSVAGFEFTDDRLHSSSQIKDLLPVPVICEIPEVINAADEQIARKKTVLGWAMAATVAVIILAGSAVSFIHG